MRVTRKRGQLIECKALNGRCSKYLAFGPKHRRRTQETFERCADSEPVGSQGSKAHKRLEERSASEGRAQLWVMRNPGG
ncbi:hypothetical protein AMATHDRAFT_57475 [Amanita thiersii Skay4041]|uniref:Uncharacterized protein n=1 Tax=Amanita thiersii Skay4041 TaxID=703135 RepID=A0A2A9NV24_9AGAR|nr:hypothetical protein AMATHDRAFT_57475 [Amanita thiersii Skay4041]